MLPGLVTIPTSCLKLIKMSDQLNSDIDTCGYDAYVKATGSTITLDVFRRVAQAENMFSVD